MTDSYDPDALTERLGSLDRTRATAFAAMCAELLAPVWPRYCELTRLSDPRLVEESLDHLWAALGGDDRDLSGDLEKLEAAAPDEDDDPYVFETGYAMNASSSAVYAVRTWLGGEVQQTEWAARQVWEAADLTAEDEDDEATFGPPDGQDDVMVAAAAFVDESLAAASDPAVGVDDLRAQARAAAARWWQQAS